MNEEMQGRDGSTTRRFRLRTLCSALGPRRRYRISLAIDDDTAWASVVWDCGCIASGRGYGSLALAPCVDHFELVARLAAIPEPAAQHG